MMLIVVWVGGEQWEPENMLKILCFPKSVIFSYLFSIKSSYEYLISVFQKKKKNTTLYNRLGDKRNMLCTKN